MINRTTLRKRMKLWQSFSNRDMERDVFATLLREDIENGNKIFSIIEKDVKTEKRFRKLLSPGSLNELSDVIIGYNMSTTIEVLLNITEKILMFECAAINKYILLRGKYERYLFSNNYKQCKEILGEIENTVGFSIWGWMFPAFFSRRIGKWFGSKQKITWKVYRRNREKSTDQYVIGLL